jgi:[acyl-carrier-protein] S-malonyltransferase
MAFAGVFPGQGSQSTGMLAELAESFSEVKATFQEASDVLDKDLWALTKEGSEAELNQTENTQPVMLAAGIAVWRIWQGQGGCQPVALAGHSLGEYSALVAAGTLDFADTVSLVSARARFMQHAVSPGQGAMAAILGLDDDQVVEVCAQAAGNQVVQAVNFNSPGQVVIAGDTDAVDRAIDKAKDAGAKRAIKLAVSVPSHCDLMKPAADNLSGQLKDTPFSDGSIAVLHNVDARPRSASTEIVEALSQQLYLPVRWVDTVKNLKSEYGADSMVEFGPGKVLFGLNRRIDRKIKTICVSDQASLDKALQFCEE